MRTVVFATSSRWKLSQAQDFLQPFGITVAAPSDFDRPVDELYVKSARGSTQYGYEIQSDNMEEVCSVKAQSAAQILQRPVVVEDIGVSISSLKGFPGPYTKYAIMTIGIPGLLRVMRDVEDRTAEMISVVGFCRPGGDPSTFVGTLHGKITDGVRVKEDNPWKDTLLYPIFVPEGESRTMAEIYPEELKQSETFPARISFSKFGSWYVTTPE
jgi:XTP/dITP diphosphohydrolase